MLGLNLTATIWEFNYESDDETGGSVPSGTILQEGVCMRMSAQPPTMVLLEQGVESIDLYEGMIGCLTVGVKNYNEVEITSPTNSPYFGEFFRVMGNPQLSSMHPSDSRSLLKVVLKRVERSRTIQ